MQYNNSVDFFLMYIFIHVVGVDLWLLFLWEEEQEEAGAADR
jgi:hypothetical protein